MKKKRAKRIFRFMALLALLLGCTVMTVPLRAGAAQSSEEKPAVWTAIEAEMARQISDGVSLREIINNAVRSGKRIHEVIASCIKVGADPSLVVHAAIFEGYAARTVVKAALQAGASLKAVVNSATYATLDEKVIYVGDVVEAAIQAGEDPSRVMYTAISEGYSARTIIRAAMKEGVPLHDAIRSATFAGPETGSAYREEVVSAAIEAGEDPSEVVRAAIAEGYSARNVVKAALKAGAPVEEVVHAAVEEGADNKAVYVGAAEAGASPSVVEKALSGAKAGGSVFTAVPSSAAALSSPALTAAPAIFGRGGIVLPQVPTWAAPTLRTGPLKINPFLSIAETFSDNIAYTQDMKKRDSITTFMPGVRLQLPFHAPVAELEYYSVIDRYEKFTGENINDHHVSGSFNISSEDRLELRFSDKFERGHEPRSSTPTGTNEVFHSNVTAVSAAYRLTDNFSMHLDLGRSTGRFITSHFRDREEDRIAGSFFYRVLPKASVFIEYGHQNIVYVDETLDLNSTVGTAQAGLTWAFSSRTKGTLKAGLARKDFTSSGMANSTVKVGSADVRHEFASNTTVVLTAQRSMNEPDIQGSKYFISTGGFAELTQRFMGKFAAVVRGAYVQDNNTSRIDRTDLGGLGLKYRATDWLEFAVDYNQRKRKSNVPGNDYTEQSSILMVSASL